MAVDNVTVELVFQLPGKLGGGFVVRAPIIGPEVRVIVINSGAQTYDFTVWGYATH
jgi:hypothetical protein